MFQRIAHLFATPMRGAHRQRGQVGERLAAKHLKKQGYRLIARNLRNRFGEIDLLALAPDGRTVVVVEVKAGAANERFPPELHVTPAKQRKIISLTAQFARRYRLTDRPFRFDVIAVEFPEQGAPVIRHHVGAFQSQV
ncbi:MAG: YraN family protein [Planctomycetota bacterium]